MKKLSGFGVLAGLAVIASMAGPVLGQSTACIEDYQPGVNYFPDEMQVEHAQGFTIEYFDHYKLMTITQPWQESGDDLAYLLVQCGAPVPEGYDDALVVEVPVDTAVSMSTTYLAGMVALDLSDSVAAVDEFDYISSPEIRARIDAGDLAEVGSGTTVNIEALLALEPGVIFTYGGGDTGPVLRDAGLTVALNSDWMEASPLGRAEWVKFIAAFFNREAEANALFEGIESEYTALAALTTDMEDRPTVLLNAMYNDTWYAAGGASYMATLVADAGGDYLWAEDASTGALPLSFETVLDRASEAEVWLNPNYWFSLADGMAEDERYALFTAFQTGSVYNSVARVNETFGNDYAESGALHPEWVLADLIAILHPELLPDHDLYYFVQLQ